MLFRISTDVRRSNSAAMYLALTSYAANGDVLTDRATARALAARLAELFKRQGYQENYVDGNFDDYVAIGIGKTPMAFIYENQLVRYALTKKGVAQDMVLLYPQPTIVNKVVFVAMNERAKALADALANDAELQGIAVEYGFKSWDACCQASAAELYKMITKTHKRRRFDVQTQARIREILREQQVRIPPESLCRPIHAFSIYPIIGGASSTLQAAIEMANENARRREWGIDLVHYSIAVSEHQAQAIISAFESEGIPFWRKQDLKSYWYALKVPHALPRAYEEICEIGRAHV